MHAWFAPGNAGLWVRRLLSLRTMLWVSGVCIFALTEFRFDWIERAVGAYLVTTNQSRPESGAIWEQGRQTHLARKTLETYVHERRNTLREARGAASLGQVIDSISGESGAMISADHFVELYQKLPPVLANEIVSPYTVLSHASGGQWQRTFFEQQGVQLLIFFLDDNNQVLHRLVVGQTLLTHIRRGEVAIDAGLDQLIDLSARIYEAERFFQTLNTFPTALRKGVIAYPEDLLRVSGRIARVGVSDAAVAGAVDLGFEVESAEGTKVILMQGRQQDVRQLQQALDGRSFYDWPPQRSGEGP